MAVGVAGVALGDIDRHFAWQAWHLTSTVTLRGRRGTYGTELALVARSCRRLDPSPFGAVVAAAVGVAGVALGDIATVTLRCRRGTGLALVARLGLRWALLSPRLLAWQAWHLVTSTFTLRGRRGSW